MQIMDERDFVVRRWSNLYELDWFILAPVFFLVIFGLFLLKSAEDGAYFTRQLLFLLPAFLLGFSILFIRIYFWKSISLWVYLINVFLLLAVLVMGSSALGAQRWINLGLVKIQPSEISKIAIIITLAAWFSKHQIKNYFDILISGLITFIPFILIFKQPDLGTSLTFVAIYLGMAFWAGAKITHLLVVISPVLSLIFNAIGSIIFSFGTVQINNKIIEITITQYFILFLAFLLVWLVINYRPWKSPWTVLLLFLLMIFNFLIGFIRPILWSLLQPYQQHRLTIFLNPESDPLGAGYHIIQSLLAIGNGGFFGYGWQHGRLTKGHYVPAQHTDFVFSICGEEFGFIGSVLVLCMFAIILYRVLYIAKNSNNLFASLLSVGIFSYFAFHIFINIGMSIGIMPITGVPLILLSYGGTALFVNLFSVFILLSISWRTLPRKLF